MGFPLLVIQILHLFFAVLFHHTHAVSHVLFRQRFSTAEKCEQTVYRTYGTGHILLVPCDLQFRIPEQKRHMIFLFNQPDIFIKTAEQFGSLLHSVKINVLFQNFFLNPRFSSNLFLL